MSGVFWVLLAAIPFSPASLRAAEKSRPMEEMHGDCANYAMDLKGELKLWEGGGTRLKAVGHVAPALPAIEAGRKVELELVPRAGFRPLAKPGRDARPGEQTFAGLAGFKVQSDGTYRVSGGSSFWFEVLDQATGKAVESDAFEMQTRCDRIYKVVSFKLKAGKSYLVQITAAKKPAVQLLLSREG